MPAKLYSPLSSYQKLSSLEVYELSAGNRSIEKTNTNFVFESLWHVILVKLLFASRLLTSKELNHASRE